MGTAGDDPKVFEAKIQGDVDFAWVPRQIEGDGREREREKVANLRERERNRERESETLCIVVWAPSLSNFDDVFSSKNIDNIKKHQQT